MKAAPLDAASLAAINAVISQCPWLSLSDSRTALPGSLGAGLPLLQVETEQCSALISLQGAHLLQFKTRQGNPLLWVSPNCDFTPGAALRGGIPLCLPWFGPAPDDASKPKHGFARNEFWQLSHAQLLPDGTAALSFVITHSADAQFGYDFSAELRLFLGASIKCELTVNNTGFSPFDCSFAFHSYFAVNHLAGVTVPELTGRTYKDNMANHRSETQTAPLDFTAAVDRLFPAVESTLTLTTSPAIVIRHENCPSVIAWNPGSAAAGISDIGEGNEQYYVCVERGAALDERWHIAPGKAQTAWMEITESE